MYHPIWQDKFKDIVDLSGREFKCDNSPAARKKLLMQVNDNVLKNHKRFSVLLFDKDIKHHKNLYSTEEKAAAVEKICNEAGCKEMKEELDQAVDKILLAHRNTKLFMFMLTGPFLVLLQTFKYSIKALVFYWFYKSTTNKK